MDYAFMLSGLDASFPWLHWLLLLLPIPALRHVLAARDRLQQVCATAKQLKIPRAMLTRLQKYGKVSFDRYISQYGRNSGRKDPLTKILTTKSEDDPPMTDRETCAEIGNLVFAGTGML